MVIDCARRRCETRRDLPNPETSEAPARWVVVVPLADAALFDYLTKSFAPVKDVRVVLDRRRARPADAASREPAPNRRADPRVVSNFGCAVIRRPVAAPAEAPVSRPRTLLWPHLRIADVLSWPEDSATRR
jgi:hypothetical protein